MLQVVLDAIERKEICEIGWDYGIEEPIPVVELKPEFRSKP
jgi:hypothetical protein